MASALEIALGGIDEVEPGFKPFEYWKKLWGRHNDATKKLLLKHVNSGRMVRKTLRIRTQFQNGRPVSHWKAIK